jgi:SAM-dependent methyltransferase
MLDRVMREGETHARLAEAARALADPSLEFAERSRMYRARGLSTDTSLKINFAVEEALKGLVPALTRGATQAAPAVRRVAIVGPGLDFTDKQEGYDFHAPQTIQPFALQESLIRLGLARAETLEVTAFDLSRRVIGHLEMAAGRARAGSAYLIHLPLDGGVAWTPEFLDYWRRFGETVGSPVPVSLPPGLPGLRLRAVSVRPPVVQRVRAIDLNVTAQYLAQPEAERFDLVVGTNVFLYYDRPQQGLAMAGIASMLKPGGLLLSNNALVEIPAVGFQSVGYSKVMYSSREEDGYLIVWYQKVPK